MSPSLAQATSPAGADAFVVPSPVAAGRRGGGCARDAGLAAGPAHGRMARPRGPWGAAWTSGKIRLEVGSVVSSLNA